MVASLAPSIINVIGWRIPSNSDLYRRYLKKLNDQEDELEQIDAAMAAAQDDVNAAQNALTKYIAGLEI